MNWHRFAQRKEQTVQLICEADVVRCAGEAVPIAVQVPGPGHQFGENERLVQAGRMIANRDQRVLAAPKVSLQTLQVPVVVVDPGAVEKVQPQFRQDGNAGHHNGAAEPLQERKS